MIKRVFVAQVSITNGDEFDLAVCDSLHDAQKAIDNDQAHTTKQEAKNRKWSICAWDIPVEEGQTIKEAYNTYVSECCWMPDPDVYIPCK